MQTRKLITWANIKYRAAQSQLHETLPTLAQVKAIGNHPMADAVSVPVLVECYRPAAGTMTAQDDYDTLAAVLNVLDTLQTMVPRTAQQAIAERPVKG